MSLSRDVIRSPGQPHWLPLLFFAASILFCLLSPCPVFNDADIGWHMATGAWISDHGAIPEHDVFSFTAGDTRWRNFSILPDIAMNWLFERDGFSSLFIATAILTGIAIYLVALNVQHTGAGFFSVFLVMLCVTMGLHTNATMRPQLITFVLAPLFYFLLARHRHQPDYWIYLLAPLTAFWVNCHAGFLVGFTLIGAFIMEAFVEGYRRRKPGRPEGALLLICTLLVLWVNTYAGFIAAFAVCAATLFWREKHHRPLVTTAGLCFMASLINPAGLQIYTAAQEVMNMEITEYTMEWGTFKFGHQLDLTLYTLLMIFFCRPFSPAIPLADKLLGLGWWLLALYVTRYMPIALILGAPFVARSVAQVTAEWGKLAAIERFNARCDAGLRTLLARGGITAVALVALALAFVPSHQVLPKPDFYLPQEMDYLFTHLPDARVWAGINQAGYLVYEAYQRCGSPEARKGENPCSLKVFTDGRAEMAYPAKVLRDYIAVTYEYSRKWEKVLDRYQVDALLLGKDNPLYQRFPHPGWDIPYRTKEGVVIARRPSAEAE